jgi:hypothetical protein
MQKGWESKHTTVHHEGGPVSRVEREKKGREGGGVVLNSCSRALVLDFKYHLLMYKREGNWFDLVRNLDSSLEFLRPAKNRAENRVCDIEEVFILPLLALTENC